MSATTSSMDARCVSTSKIGLQHYFLDPLIGSLPANASEQQVLEAEPMDMTMPGCFRRRWRSALSYSTDARLTRGGHTC